MISSRYAEGVYEYVGLSEDAKPTENVKNGCVFFEMDTKDVYMYDEKNKQWRKI